MVLEGFIAVDEDDGDFVGELAPELIVGVDVNFLQGEAAAAVEFVQSFFYHFAEMTSFTRVDDDVAGLGHAGSVAEEFGRSA